MDFFKKLRQTRRRSCTAIVAAAGSFTGHYLAPVLQADTSEP